MFICAFQEIEEIEDPEEKQTAQAVFKVAPPNEQMMLVQNIRDGHNTEVQKLKMVSLSCLHILGLNKGIWCHVRI